MYVQPAIKRVLVTGASGFLGFRVVAALLEAGLEVTVLIRQEQDDKLLSVANRVRIVHSDIWNKASLKGLSRGQDVVIHLVGSTKVDPARGLTYQQINLVSARNVISMAVSDGVLNCILLSAASLPGMLPGQYIFSKREAEEYLQNSGLQWSIVRAPLLYMPSVRRPILGLLSGMAVIPPFRWVVGRYLPLSVDVAARGIAAVAQEMTIQEGRILYANDLRRLAHQNAPRRPLIIRQAMGATQSSDDDLDEVPFGWLPNKPRRR